MYEPGRTIVLRADEVVFPGARGSTERQPAGEPAWVSEVEARQAGRQEALVIDADTVVRFVAGNAAQRQELDQALDDVFRWGRVQDAVERLGKAGLAVQQMDRANLRSIEAVRLNYQTHLEVRGTSGSIRLQDISISKTLSSVTGIPRTLRLLEPVDSIAAAILKQKKSTVVVADAETLVHAEMLEAVATAAFTRIIDSHMDPGAAAKTLVEAGGTVRAIETRSLTEVEAENDGDLVLTSAQERISIRTRYGSEETIAALGGRRGEGSQRNLPLTRSLRLPGTFALAAVLLFAIGVLVLVATREASSFAVSQFLRAMRHHWHTRLLIPASMFPLPLAVLWGLYRLLRREKMTVIPLRR